MTSSRAEALGITLASSSVLTGRAPLMSGAAAGLLGGVVMAIFLVILAGASGMPWLKPLQAIGATFVGPVGLGGSGQAIYGAFLHALASAAFGLLYAAIFPRDFPPLCGAVTGAGYALLALAIMASMVVPIVIPSFRAEMQPIGGSWVVAHALFGAAMGLLWALWGRSFPDGGGTVGRR